MSYIRAFETDTLPKLPRPVELTESARRIRTLEEELSVYKRCVSPKQGTCKYCNNDWGANYSRRSIAEVFSLHSVNVLPMFIVDFNQLLNHLF